VKRVSESLFDAPAVGVIGIRDRISYLAVRISQDRGSQTVFGIVEEGLIIKACHVAVWVIVDGFVIALLKLMGSVPFFTFLLLIVKGDGPGALGSA